MPETKSVLLVEDNIQLNEINRRLLQSAGYRVLTARSLGEARAHLRAGPPDAIILDILLPDGNGVDFCREIRETVASPILFLTSVNGYEQTLEGLAAGGDDYLDKPTDNHVLLAKVASFFRRDDIAKRIRNADDKVRCGALLLDIVAQRAFWAEKELSLSPKEFALLLILVRHEGQFLSKEYLYEAVWQQPVNDDARAVWTHISILKKKLALNAEGTEGGLDIDSERSRGYRLRRRDG